MRIVLIGPRGSGKTTIGALLADRMGWRFLDTDGVVEETEGISIPDIFTQRGEPAFRDAETAAIRSLPPDGVVVATGGGAVLRSSNVQALRAGSLTVFLDADSSVLAARTAGGTRPPLTGLSHAEETATVRTVRLPLYRGAADLCFNTGNIPPEMVVRQITEFMEERQSPAFCREFVAFLEQTRMERREWRTVEERLCGTAGMPLHGLYAVIGNPCLHSRSPELFTALFAACGVDGVYTRIEWPVLDDIMTAVRSAGLKGLSVTIPFKSDVMQYCDEITADAHSIGAVNTVVRCGDRVVGANTDWVGIRQPLAGVMAGHAVVFGAGGAARAAVYALQDLGMDVTVLNRTPERAQRIANHFGCEYGTPDAYDPEETDVIVNATPVGMEGREGTVLEANALRAHQTVFDLVYTPPETELLRNARHAGCRCIRGTEMFVHQAQEQMRLFTGVAAEAALIREILE
ncbi:shikimate dehydrogenase [Methanogenium organophilum]|uniref:Shikimate dehydrogenase (NADP(+)) n=1 Tax=Methanogenium organophilum TaxID=2199 RepID=A0A9X9T8Z7_METOG|nr:shikimate dehydrogenase [Methanogenium organophilum]WAI01931.1 shikimate dehydrogenase [Methanogenium organophilum]